jgi:hypothetical protein
LIVSSHPWTTLVEHWGGFLTGSIIGARRLIGTDRASFTAGWPPWLQPFTRPYVTSLAYLLCGFTNFELIGSYGRLALARRVFGQQPVQDALDEISTVASQERCKSLDVGSARWG